MIAGNFRICTLRRPKNHLASRALQSVSNVNAISDGRSPEKNGQFLTPVNLARAVFILLKRAQALVHTIITLNWFYQEDCRTPCLTLPQFTYPPCVECINAASFTYCAPACAKHERILGQ